ncbi:MAG: hypothetical protein Q9216_005359, partial [Gyalolechia sp. 2 TL-2023]
MLRNVYLPKIIGGSNFNGNWELGVIGAVMMEAAQGIAVFLNDGSSYDKAMTKFFGRAPAYVYLTSDGSCPKAAPGSGLSTCSQINDFWGQYSYPQNGIAQETCRDFAHTGYGISSMSHIAETSKIQGNDLWTGDVGTRIRYALGFHSQFEMGASVPSWLCGGSVDLKKGKSDFAITEVGYNALHGRLGISMTNTGLLTQDNRPGESPLTFVLHPGLPGASAALNLENGVYPIMGSDIVNRARIILEAVHLASAVEVSSLHQLIAREAETLQLELVLRIILTYLPESTSPNLYTELLHQLSLGAVHAPPTSSIRPAPSGRELSDNEARHRVRQLHLLPLAEEQDLQAGCSDILSLFLIHRSRRIDAETGSIPQIQELLEPFVDRDPYLRTWMISIVLPLRRLNYEYYNPPEDASTLEAFEKLEGRPAIDSLLARSVQASHEETVQSARDIRCVVGPWIYGESRRKRRKTHHNRRRSSLAGSRNVVDLHAARNEDSVNGWSDVNDWVVNLALRDFPSAAETIDHWGGPVDIDYGGYSDIEEIGADVTKTLLQRYAQAGLATVYTNTETSTCAFEKTHDILRKVAHLSNLEDPSIFEDSQGSAIAYVSRDYLDQISEVHVLHNALLRPDNPLTYPGQLALLLANLLLKSATILQKLGHPKSCKATLGLTVFSRREEQIDELHRTLQKIPVKTRDEDSWAKVRHQILWLRDWRYQVSMGGIHDEDRPIGVFGKIEREHVEIELLRALLRASCYNLAAYVYCMQDDRSISEVMLEKTILSVAMSFYDGASNGNRTRGGVRKASEIIAAFQSHFPRSTSFNEANALITATHSMSFYSLTLQHGVPFQPVNIRASKDPMSLIGKILEQNPRSYTKLDDLIEIGQNLTKAGLSLTKARDSNPRSKTDQVVGLDHQLSEPSRLITSMAIEAALGENDFDTAYSYIVNRLSPTVPTSPTAQNQNQANTNTEIEDDISWRAAYLAGRSSPSSPP